MYKKISTFSLLVLSLTLSAMQQIPQNSAEETDDQTIVRLLHTSRESYSASFQGHGNNFYSPIGLFKVCHDGKIHDWSLREYTLGYNPLNLNGDVDTSLYVQLYKDQAPISSHFNLALSPDHSKLLFTVNGFRAHIYRLNPLQKIFTHIPTSQKNYRAAAISCSARYIAYITDDNYLDVHDTHKRKVHTCYPSNPPEFCTFNKQETKLIALLRNQQHHIVDLKEALGVTPNF